MTLTSELLAPMRRATDPVAFMGRLRDAAEAAIDVVAPQSRLRLNEDGTCNVNAGDLTVDALPTRGAIRDVSERLRIPLPYLDRLMDEHPDLARTSVNTLADRDPRNAMYRMWQAEDGWVLRAMLSDSYGIYDNFTVLQALTNGLTGAGLSVADCEVSVDLTSDRFRMRIATPSVELLVPELLDGYRFPYDTTPGADVHAPAPNGHVPPVLWAGLDISNSETGNGAFTITPRAIVLICRNGLTRSVDAIRSVHLGGRLEAGQVAWSAETRRLNVELLTSKVTDAVGQFLSVDYLRKLADEMRAAKGLAVNNPAATIERVSVAHKLSEDETNAVMAAFMRGGDATLLGVGQAITAAAALVPEGDRQAEMESMFWAVVSDARLVNA
jgi:hypothetical protein